MTHAAPDQIAPIPRRAIGYAIDALIATGLSMILFGAVVVFATLAGADGMLSTLLVGLPLVTILLLAWFFVYTWMQSAGGSIGMRAQGLRLVAAGDQGRLGFGRALVRNIVFGLASSIVVGYFTPLFDGSGRFQGWHDKVAGSLMLSTRGAAAGAVAAAPPLATAAAPAVPASAGAGAPPIAPAAATPIPPAAPAVPSTAAAAASPRPTASAEEGLISFVPGVTQGAPIASAPSASVSPSVPAPAEADLDATVQGIAPVRPPASTAPPAPVPPPAPAVPTAPAVVPAVVGRGGADDIDDTRISIPGHRLVFTWDDGTRVSVSRRTVFGRNPAAEDGVVAVSVRDETLSLSKTHFEAAAEPSGGWVLDRHSTNGMTLIRDGQRIACPAGQRVPVRLGDAIEIGDRLVTIGGYA